MDNSREFIFNITPINCSVFLEEISSALEKRTELISRARNPKTWAYTDKLNAKEKSPETVLKKRRAFRKIVSVINLTLGIILFVPGLMEPKELLTPLIVGAFAITAGIVGLFGKRGNRKNQFLKPAKLLLQGKDTIIAGENQIVFSENQMKIVTSHTGAVVIPYSEFEYIIETKNAFLLTYQGNATILQKKDFQENALQDFCDFVCWKTSFVSLNKIS
ncbi:MAG: YcxB family protein [Clostridiaceae bacterium]|nr:YcxB family protein [Clostridiaceae bacterium]